MTSEYVTDAYGERWRLSRAPGHMLPRRPDEYDSVFVEIISSAGRDVHRQLMTVYEARALAHLLRAVGSVDEKSSYSVHAELTISGYAVWQLHAESRALAEYPAGITVRVYERYEEDEGDYMYTNMTPKDADAIAGLLLGTADESEQTR